VAKVWQIQKVPLRRLVLPGDWGAARWSDPSGNLPCHFDPLLRREAVTVPPRWGGETLVQLFVHAACRRCLSSSLFYTTGPVFCSFSAQSLALVHDLEWYRTHLKRPSALLFNAVVINKCFLLNPEKKFGADPSCRFREKAKDAPLIPKNDVTEPKARLL